GAQWQARFSDPQTMDQSPGQILAPERLRGTGLTRTGNNQMIQRPVPLTEPRGARDGAVHEVDRVFHRGFERAAHGQSCGDCRGERTAGTVRGGCCNSSGFEAAGPVPGHEDVGYDVAPEVPAFDER